MIQDSWYTRSWKEKLTLWWRPTGYRPSDVVLKYPKTKISTEIPFEKYNPKMSFFKKAWALVQWLCINVLLLFLLSNYDSFSSTQALLGGLIMTSIFGFTSLMDGYHWSYAFELGRNLLGMLFFCLPHQNNFYLTHIPGLFYFGIIYFSLSTIALQMLDQKKKTSPFG